MKCLPESEENYILEVEVMYSVALAYIYGKVMGMEGVGLWIFWRR